MAELGAPIAAAQQFQAVAELRWRLFRNGFRRKGNKGEMVARVVVMPLAGLLLLLPVAACFGLSYAAVRSGRVAALEVIFTAVFVLQVLVSIQISPPQLSFAPESLIRFPLSFPRYLTIRLFLGLLSTSTVVGTLCLLAGAAGATVAQPRLAAVAFGAALGLAVTNMLFTRMVFAWVDRWLATRRAREVFTLLIFAFSIGVQYVNVTVNNLGHRDSHAQQLEKISAAMSLYRHAQYYVIVLPPGMAGAAIGSFSRGATGLAAAEIGAVLLYAVAFLGVFGWRLEREYRGENLSEGSVPRERKDGRLLEPARLRAAGTLWDAWRGSPVLGACVQKEWIYLRRNLSQFYGLMAPLVMVFLFAGRMGNVSRGGMVLPAGAAYALLGIAALAYNLFGADAGGVQFYFLAPVEMRTVVLAKNLFGFCLAALQVLLLYAVLLFTTGAPPLPITLGTVCWVVFAALLNATIGNVRSITAPKKMDPGRVARKQASPLSALISVGTMLGAAALGAGLLALATLLGRPWLPVPVLLACDVGAGLLYVAGLSRVDDIAWSHRETFLEELSKESV